MKKPYMEKILNESTVIRGFARDTKQADLVWHRDSEPRTIIVVEGTGWRFQRDNGLPQDMSPGDRIRIDEGEFHRIIKGSSDLIVAIIKEKKDQNKDGKNDFEDVKIARMKASGMTDSEIKKKHPDLFNEVEEGHCGGASESHCNEDSLSSKDLKENESKKLVCPKCGTHNDLGIKKCANCGHPYDDKFGEKKWKEVASEGDLGEGKKKKKTDFDVGGQPQYRAKRSQKQIDKQADLTRKYNAAKTEKQKQKYRDMIDRSREKEGTNEGMIRLTSSQLSEIISETIEAQKLEMMLEKVEEIEEKKKRKKSGKSKKGLSKAVKKSLDKKADRRCLTRGSVYAEFRKGLAAYYSSGSRKGMSAHQWAHARVNSANPSKKWAVVKKRKKCPKKKK